VLVIKSIHVVYHLSGAADRRQTVERIHSIHADHCPVYRSIHKAIAVTTEMRFE
jgi:uncharacterized OsmC-like protein